MKISQTGVDLIKSFEGLRLEPYQDIAGIFTIGYGTTRYPSGEKVKKHDRSITEQEAESYLRNDISYFEKQVDAMTRDDITQNQFDSLVSFAYNLGYNALKGSTLLKKVNVNPNDPSIKQEFMRWVYANGRKSKGILNRRINESDLYFNPYQ